MTSAYPKKLSLVVPAYNKDQEVFERIVQLVNQLKTLAYDWEIIVVDDASRDFTLREAIRSKKFNGNTDRIKVFSYNLNQGKGFALYHGFKKSSGEIIVFTDSDLDLPAQNLPVMLRYLAAARADMAIGSKRHPLSHINYPRLRKMMSRVYQLLIKLLFNLNVTDTQVGLKAFRRQVLEDCFPRIVIKAFAFDLEMLVVAASLGYKNAIETPIILNYNFTSTIKLKAIWNILVDTLAIFYRKKLLRYYKQPHYRLEQDEVVIASQKVFI